MTEKRDLPTIAVIVPNWNDARYLPRALRSVLDQEVGADELIVVDDQSTDNSVEVIARLIEGHANAQLIVNPVNLGTNGALNEGLARMKSEYVLFLASNDFVLDGIFARAKACLARAPGIGLWSAMAWLVDEADRPIRLHPSPVVTLRDAALSPGDCVRLAHRFGNWFTGTTLIYHRDALRAAGGFDPAYGGLSDLITALVVATRAGASYSPEPYAAIRMHAGSFLSGTLKDVDRLELTLARLKERGPMLSPALFTDTFQHRTALRLRFAAVRASGGDLGVIGDRITGLQRAALQFADRALPQAWRRMRVLAAFLILRPFDIGPTVINRIMGWAYVRARLLLRRQAF